MNFQTPQPGDVVTVTTRHRNHYYKRTSDFTEETYENVTVLRPFSWLSNFEFCITAEGPECFTHIEIIERRNRAPKFDTSAMRYESAFQPNDEHAPKFDARVIHMRNVISINGVDVSNEDFSVQTVEVTSSNGGTYKVQIEGRIGTTCECKGFQFRKSCRHLKEAEDILQ